MQVQEQRGELARKKKKEKHFRSKETIYLKKKKTCKRSLKLKIPRRIKQIWKQMNERNRGLGKELKTLRPKEWIPHQRS